MCLLRTEILPELVPVASIPPCALLRICPGLSTTLSTAHTWAQAATTSPEPEISTLHRAGLGWAGLGWAGLAGLGWAGLGWAAVSAHLAAGAGGVRGWCGPGARWAVHRVTGEQRYITAATHRHTASSRPLRQPAQHSK